MKRLILAPFAALLACLTLGSAPASAQFTYPFRPPQYGPGYQTQLSPYLNLLRGGDPAANYFIGVVPEFQRRQDRNALYSSVQGLANQIPLPPGITDRDIDVPLSSAGHPTAFGYTGSYFSGNAPTRPVANPFPQRRAGAGPGQRPGQMPGQGGGIWPNMMPQMGGPPRR